MTIGTTSRVPLAVALGRQCRHSITVTQTDADTDSWAAYGTAVNGFITGYWNSEAQSDADETHAINAAYVTWVTDWDAAWVAYEGDVAAADAQQALDDAQSANDAWHLINAAAAAQFVADADASNVYNHAMAPIESAYASTMEAAWVVYADTMSDAGHASTTAGANAKAAAFGRWASAEGGPYSAYAAAVEAAQAALTAIESQWWALREREQHAADAAWVGTVLPAWVTYQGEVSDHAAAYVAEAAPAWETCENAYTDADLAYTTAAVPLGVALSADLSGNYSDWVNQVAAAEQTYGDELADHGVTYVAVANSAKESWADATIVNWTTYVHTRTGLDVMLSGAIGTAIEAGAGIVAGQLIGMPYSVPISTNPLVTVSGTGNTAYAAGSGAAGNGVTWYNPFTWLNPLFNQANLDESELREYAKMIAAEKRSLDFIFARTGVRYSSLDEVPDQVLMTVFNMDAATAATVRSPRHLEKEAIAGGSRALTQAEGALYIAAAADAAALGALALAAAKSAAAARAAAAAIEKGAKIVAATRARWEAALLASQAAMESARRAYQTYKRLSEEAYAAGNYKMGAFFDQQAAEMRDIISAELEFSRGMVELLFPRLKR